MKTIPLAVDLDGSLILTDMLHESAVAKAHASPLSVALFLPWLRKGKSYLKGKLSEDFSFDPTLLPYNAAFLAYLRKEHAQGRELILCTATHAHIAEKIAASLAIFSSVMATEGTVNLAGEVKARALVERFGEQGFDYAGNGQEDLTVWKHARRVLVINASESLKEEVERTCTVELFVPQQTPSAKQIAKALRLHQWLKNLLLFAPALAGHVLFEENNLWVLFLAFVSFGCCASSVYLINDLFDLENDRRHLRKKNRPLAAGIVSIRSACMLVPILLTVSLILALMVGTNFLTVLSIYFALTTLYSFWLKRLLLLDCIVLALLYTMRIFAGGAAIDLKLSFWIMTFSVFLFLALAFIKRYAELLSLTRMSKKAAPGRSYVVSDGAIIQNLGISSGYISVLVMALYLNSNEVIVLYKKPEILWLLIPVLLFWVSWLWLQTHRGKMDDDPVLFAVRDPVSLLCGVLFLSIATAASIF